MTWYSNMPAKRLEFIDDLEVWVIEKKRMRNMRLHVQPDGRVEVSVPIGYPPRFIEEFVRQKHDFIVAAQQHYQDSPMGRAAVADPAEVRQWRQVVEAFVPALIEKWEPVLGVKAGPVAYRKMKSRWGSCQAATGRLCFNVVLALYPPECLEYVVVHELAHLRVPNHGAEFKALMDQALPDWRERKAKLR